MKMATLDLKQSCCPQRREVPPEKNLIDPNDALAKENAILDRKMKSICRGC
jgi:hypothetical protein